MDSICVDGLGKLVEECSEFQLTNESPVRVGVIRGVSLQRRNVVLGTTTRVLKDPLDVVPEK